ncbi:MAG TPA: extracellular solute-binding protein [Anaerolineales bacterium]|nr:extracellular solute-binding protein [Anaerolineales bacterium]
MTHKFYRMLAALVVAAILVTACGSTATPTPEPQAEADPQPSAEPEPSPETDPGAPGAEGTLAPGALVIYSGRREPLIQPVIDAFKAEYPNIDVVLKSGGNSELANELLEEQGNPQADIFITTEVFTVQALYLQGIFENYVSPGAASIPAEYKQPDGGWTAVTLRGRVIMYNTDLVKPEEAPQSIFDLADPKWKAQVAAANSANGSLQAQIAVMQKLLGGEKTEEWLQGLLANEAAFFGGHTDVRKAVGAGEFKLGLVNHYYYYLQKAEGSPVGLVIPDQAEGQIGLIVNASAAAIVKGGHNTEAAKRFVDFLLSPEGQELFAALNYEYPVIPGVPLHPDVEPLTDYRIADVNLAEATVDLDATLDLIEKVGLP